MLGLFAETIIFFIPIATLLVKYGKMLARIESNNREINSLRETVRSHAETILSTSNTVKRHTEDIDELKESQKKYQTDVKESLDEIKVTLASVNTGLQVLTTRFDYIEREKE